MSRPRSNASSGDRLPAPRCTSAEADRIRAAAAAAGEEVSTYLLKAALGAVVHGRLSVRRGTSPSLTEELPAPPCTAAEAEQVRRAARALRDSASTYLIRAALQAATEPEQPRPPARKPPPLVSWRKRAWWPEGATR